MYNWIPPNYSAMFSFPLIYLNSLVNLLAIPKNSHATALKLALFNPPLKSTDNFLLLSF